VLRHEIDCCPPYLCHHWWWCRFRLVSLLPKWCCWRISGSNIPEVCQTDLVASRTSCLHVAICQWIPSCCPNMLLVLCHQSGRPSPPFLMSFPSFSHVFWSSVQSPNFCNKAVILVAWPRYFTIFSVSHIPILKYPAQFFGAGHHLM
jgi:hypothetical protein